MSDKELLTPEDKARIVAVGSVDLAVGVAARDGARPAIELAQHGLTERFPGLRAVVIHAHAGGDGQLIVGENGAPSLLELPCRPGPGAGSATTGQPWPRATAARMIFEAGQRLGARACALLDAEVGGFTPDRVGRLLAPVMDRDFDLVAPYYTRHPFDGAINTGILYPLTRALSGQALRYPLGVEFACSGRLMDRVTRSDLWQPRTGSARVDPWLTATAAGGFRLCQAVLGPWARASGDGPTDLPAILNEALSPIFAEMQRSTAGWQKVRGSAGVELIGERGGAIEPVSVDLKRLLDAFRLGQQNLLRDVWALVLPPSTLVEVKRMAGLPDTSFRLPDALWTRIIYDFSLAFHVRTMSREHLMGALAPLYLGWFGSLVAEMGDAGVDRLEDRLEQLCLTFESEKPYLISRWRWPDRFNP